MPEQVPAELVITRAMTGTVFSLAFATRLHGPCYRCLGDAVLEVPIKAREYQASSPDDEELTTPYVVADRLEVSEWARDAVALALPEKILCRPDCAGLCPVCGKNLNDEPHEHDEETADPRWAALEALREQTLVAPTAKSAALMAVPKRKTSKSRRDKRRAHAFDRGAAGQHLPAVQLAEAAAPRLPDLRHLQGPRGRAAPLHRSVAVARVAVDALGGDRAPDEVVAGALDAAADGHRRRRSTAPPGSTPAGSSSSTRPSSIEMAEKPAEAVRVKPDSSLVAAVRAVADGNADAVVSAGNTGAMLAAGLRLPAARCPACCGRRSPCRSPRASGRPC